MVEQDYIMRSIKEMIRAILKLLFHIDTESLTAELLESVEEKETLNRLLRMVDQGNINEAENYIYDLVCDGNAKGLEIALLFYAYLNDKTDDFLEDNDFSREEIKLGIEDIAERFGLSSMAQMFLKDL